MVYTALREMPDDTSFCTRPLLTMSSTIFWQYDELTSAFDAMSLTLWAPAAIADRTFLHALLTSVSDATRPSASRENTDIWSKNWSRIRSMGLPTNSF